MFKTLTTLILSVIFMDLLGQNYITAKQFAEKLYNKKIISEANNKRLLADIDKGVITDRILSGLSYLNYCDNAIVIELANYSDDPSIYLEKIHAEVAKMFTELSFTDFKFKIILDSTVSDATFKSYNVIVSLKCNGKIYQQKSFIEPDKKGPDLRMGYFGKIDGQSFYQIFNKILADNQSPYRLHFVESSKNNAVDYDRFGIIALTKDQAEMLLSGGVFFTPSYENFKNTLTSKKIIEAISAYQQIGLFTHLSKEQIATSTSKVSQATINNLNDVVSKFPSVVVFFDSELDNLDNPYEELLNKFSNISHGLFNATNISDNFKAHKNTVEVKFNLNEKHYTKQLEYNIDWIDPAFFDLIEQAAKENNIKGKFYNLFTGGQDIMVIFFIE